MFTHLKILKAEKSFSPIYRMRKYDNIDRGCIITSSNTHIYAKQQVIFKLYNLWVSKLWKLFCSEDQNRFQFEKEEGVAEFGKVESLESWGKMRLSIYNGEVNCPYFLLKEKANITSTKNQIVFSDNKKNVKLIAF